MSISRLAIDSASFLDDTIGETGVSKADIEALSPRLDKLRQQIKEWQCNLTSLEAASRAIANRFLEAYIQNNQKWLELLSHLR